MNKRIMKKWMMVLAIVLCLNTVAFATSEGAESAPVSQSEQVKEEKKAEKKEEAEKPAEAEKKEEKKEEAEKPAESEKKEEAPVEAEKKEEAAAPAEDVTAEPEAPAETEAPAEEGEQAEAPAEETEAPTEETEDGSEATEDEEVEIDDYETPLGLTPDENRFTGSVQIEMKNQGDIFFGDTVTLEANVSNANTAYDIRWEVNRHDSDGWSTISGQTGKTYDFTITENNADYDYRVVLSTKA